MRNILSKGIELTKWTVGLAVLAALVACGGSGGRSAPPAVQVANANVVAPVSATTVAALVPAAGRAPIVATFANGFSGTAAGGAAVNLTGATTLAFTAPAVGTTAPIFTIVNPAGTASGTTSFGSCHFTVTASTIPALPVGTVMTVDPCNLNITTSGDLSDGTSNDDSVTLTLGTTTSDGFFLAVTIGSGGTVTIGGVTVGSVTLTPVTGATGAGG